MRFHLREEIDRKTEVDKSTADKHWYIEINKSIRAEWRFKKAVSIF